jgi:hypothetical protein
MAKMPSAFRCALIVIGFACTHPGASCATTAPLTTVTRLGTSSMDVSCTFALGGACHYLILTSLCQEKFLPDGTKERTCRYDQAVPPFRLRSGERKTVTSLPADFLYTMKIGSAPTMDECIRAPLPH